MRQRTVTRGERTVPWHRRARAGNLCRVGNVREAAGTATTGGREMATNVAVTPRARSNHVEAHRSPREYGIGACLLALAVALPLFRQVGTRSWQTIWSEDGSVYFQEARSDGRLAVLFRGYAGYLQLPPRMLGAIATLVPTRELAVYFALSAVLINALLAWFVFWASDGWVTSRPARLALASLVVLMPALGAENTATITNTIWAFAAVAPWALVAQHENTGAVVARSAVAFLAATATALTLLYLPLAFGFAFVRRTRAAWVVVAAFVAGLVVQLGVVLHTHDDRPQFGRPVRQLSKWPELMSVRVFAEYLLSDKAIRALWDVRIVVIIGAPAVVLAVLAVRFARADHAARLLALSFLVLAIATFAVPVWGRGMQSVALTQADAGPLHFTGFQATRYLVANRLSVVPVMALASSAAILLGRTTSHTQAQLAARVWALVFVAQIGLVTLVGFSVHNARSDAKPWLTTVATKYRTECGGVPSSDPVSVPDVFGSPLSLKCRDLAP